VVFVGCGSQATSNAPADPGVRPSAGTTDASAQAAAAPAITPEIIANHPWAHFKVGSFVQLKSTSRSGPPTTTKQTLVDLTSDKATVLMETTVGNKTATNKVELPLNNPAKPAADGTETIAVSGKKYLCQRFHSQNGVGVDNVLVQSWLSADVPGSLVRSISNPGKDQTVTEIVSYEAK
jgi:hypothetical protein